MSTTAFSAKFKNGQITITIPSSTISIPISIENETPPPAGPPLGALASTTKSTNAEPGFLGLSIQNIILILIGAGIIFYVLVKKYHIDPKMIFITYIVVGMIYTLYYERSTATVKLSPTEELEVFAKRFQAIPTIITATSMLGSTLPMFMGF